MNTDKNDSALLKSAECCDIIITAAEYAGLLCCQKNESPCLFTPRARQRAKKIIRKRVIIMASKSKKVVALVLTAMMAVTALAGCGGSDNEPGSPKTPTTSKTSTTSTEEAKTVDLNDAETVSFIKGKIKEESKNGTIELVLWCAGDDLAFEKTLVKEFKEKFEGDGVTIKIKTTTKGEDEAGGAIIENAKKGGDVFSFADDQLTSLQQNGAIASVAKYYEPSVKGNSSEEAITVSSLGDKLYAFPKTSDNGYFMYYDKRIFDEADLASMDTMIEKAKAAGKNVYFNMGNAWYSTGFFFTAGCTIKYENKVQTATLGTPEGLSAAKAMAHICESQDNGFLGSPGQIGDNAFVAQGFAEGKLAAAVIGTWEGPAIKKEIGEENTGACKLPTVLMDGEQKQLDSFGGYKLVGVNVYSAYPFTAQTLAFFLTSKDSQLKRYEKRGLIPTNKEAAANDKVKSDPAFKAIDDQRPFSHAQGTSVGAVYWGSGAGSIGGDLVTAKGKISDDDLMAKLKGVEANCKSA